jgi:hypothetical protein
MFRRRSTETGGKPDQSEHRCSFCNKSQSEVRKLIVGPSLSVFICDECVETCRDVIADEAQAAASAGGDDAAGIHGREDSHLRGACALCGLPVLLDEALPIGERGFLCRGCVDAVEAAIAEEKLSD